VTLGDDEARRRGSQKSVQERAAPPTFDVAIELLGRRKWCIHPDISQAVDCILHGTHPDKFTELNFYPQSCCPNKKRYTKYGSQQIRKAHH
jgi:hypothetical protein